MRLELLDIVKQRRDAAEFPVTFTSEDCAALSSSDYEVTSVSDFVVAVVITGRKMHITGSTSVELIADCSRCLKKTDVSIPVNLDFLFEISDEEVIDDEEDPCAALSDGVLDINELLAEEILMGFPTKVLCRPDCKGICPDCGADLNISECGCDRFVADPRMQKFLDVFKG